MVRPPRQISSHDRNLQQYRRFPANIRLAIARVLLKQPRWVFADEATSALDAPAEQAVYDKLSALVQRRNGALVSIAHRPGVAAFHTRQWTLAKRPQGEETVYTIRAEALTS